MRAWFNKAFASIVIMGLGGQLQKRVARSQQRRACSRWLEQLRKSVERAYAFRHREAHALDDGRPPQVGNTAAEERHAFGP